MHPFVVGEIALGSMKRCDTIIESLTTLKPAPVASDDEVRVMIREHKIMGAGIGYVDAHILASAMLVSGSAVWTRDKRLRRVAEAMDIASAVP